MEYFLTFKWLYINQYQDYWDMDMLTDFFTEDLRMKARRADTQMSVWEVVFLFLNFCRR